MSQAHRVVAYMCEDTEDGNREDVITHVVNVVAITLRNTFVGKIARGMVLMIQKIVKPEQPNQICINEDQLNEYLRDVAIPASVASEKKFLARPNIPPHNLNTTMRPKEGYVPRGTLRSSQEAPMFK